jgi:hypothetical protein
MRGTDDKRHWWTFLVWVLVLVGLGLRCLDSVLGSSTCREIGYWCHI